MNQAADLLRFATPRIERTGYDDWNGNTEVWTVSLSVDTADYPLLGAAKDETEEQITQHLNAARAVHRGLVQRQGRSPAA